jgi:hypothetical protein
LGTITPKGLNRIALSIPRRIFENSGTNG